MGDVVNLNKFRKARARAEAEQAANQNRRKHGRTRAQKEQERDSQERLTHWLDQHHLGDAPSEPPPDPRDD